MDDLTDFLVSDLSSPLYDVTGEVVSLAPGVAHLLLMQKLNSGRSNTEPRSTEAPSGAVERKRSSDHDRESVHIKQGISGARQ